MSNQLRSIERAQKREQDKTATLAITLGDLVNARPVFNYLLQTKFPEGKGQLSLSFGRLCRDAFKELETSYDPKFNELLKQYGEPVPDAPGQFKIKDDERETMEKSVVEIIGAEIILLHRRMPELAEIFSFTPAESLAIEWLIDKPETE